MFRRPRISVVSLSAALLCLCAMADAGNKKPPLHRINLNTASPTELQEMRGIGPVAADKILKIRKSYGPSKSVDDLRAIKGIAQKRLEKMRKYLTVTQPSPKKPSQQPARIPPQKATANLAPTLRQNSSHVNTRFVRSADASVSAG